MFIDLVPLDWNPHLAISSSTSCKRLVLDWPRGMRRKVWSDSRRDFWAGCRILSWRIYSSIVCGWATGLECTGNDQHRQLWQPGSRLFKASSMRYPARAPPSGGFIAAKPRSQTIWSPPCCAPYRWCDPPGSGMFACSSCQPNSSSCTRAFKHRRRVLTSISLLTILPRKTRL